MKCIVKYCKSGLLAAAIMAAGLTGCGSEIVLEEQYNIFQTTEKYGIVADTQQKLLSFYGEDLCVGGNENMLAEDVTENISQAAGLFNLQSLEIEYAKNIHERLYPASTTKILTAYLALKYGDLQQTATVTAEDLVLEAGSTICGLSEGDKITMEQLLYGLMLCSGNDAANVIARQISGSGEEFANLMNQEALAMGASNSHFVNPHGLNDEQHYTTLYDLYLIFQTALKDERFCQIIATNDYTTEFQNSQGESITKEWTNSNRYIRGEQASPEGVTVLGGKTGTTNDAGYCLVLYSQNQNGVPYISIVLKGDSRDNLYYQMDELLKKTLN